MKNTNIKRLSYRIRHDVLTTNNLVIVIGLCIAFGWAIGSVNVMERNYKLQKSIDTKQKQLKLAELETQTLRFEKKYYQTDEYKELAVRQRLGLAFPGEKVLILPPNSKGVNDAKQSGVQKRVIQSTKATNTEQWVNFLLGSNSSSLQE
jgi:hypothetical protein